VEIVVAEVGKTMDGDQIYRITFDGSVADEHGFVVMGGQADQVAAVLKDQYSDGMTLGQAFGVAIRALAGQGNGDRQDITATQLEVALLDRGRAHRTFRRLTGPRLETLLAEALPAKKTEAITDAGSAGPGSPDTATDTGSGGAADTPGDGET
jgi:proteasome alpha subunit